MMWHGHLASGVVVAEATEPLIPHPLGAATVVPYALICGLAALVPDLDHRHGKLSHSLGPITWLLCRMTVAASKGIYQATRGPRDHASSNGHRGITHTPAFTPVLAVAAWMLVPDRWAAVVAVGLLAGQLAHLAGDACTNSGIPALWPLMGWGKNRGKRWAHYGIPQALRFETGGSVGEPIVTMVLYGLCALVPVGWLWMGVLL